MAQPRGRREPAEDDQIAHADDRGHRERGEEDGERDAPGGPRHPQAA